ncbi:type II toxin-antitoxin system PemK/MazF family toxin [Bacillus sp. FSL K6-6540]|uniref:type II toxin-antitoxin system PemK/MazF family toxin n=1 Tax=Bacillus sp. FSL K6-6540 TaxID=2921512 RepID=UPI004046C22E
MTKFQRGDVFLVDVPKMDKFPKGSPRPSYVLQGKHHFVMLHGSDEFSVPPRSVLAMPITSLENALAKGQRIAPSYVELDKQRHPFLDHDSYISTHQTMPLSRLWLHTPTGKIHPDKMFEVVPLSIE